MLSRIFNSHDMDLYSELHSENSGIVTIVIPEIGKVQMSLAKAEDLSQSIARQAEYGRSVAKGP